MQNTVVLDGADNDSEASKLFTTDPNPYPDFNLTFSYQFKNTHLF